MRERVSEVGPWVIGLEDGRMPGTSPGMCGHDGTGHEADVEELLETKIPPWNATHPSHPA